MLKKSGHSSKRRASVLILAGGKGVRLRPSTLRTPKVMLPVHGKPFIDHLISHIVYQGFRDLVLSVGYRAADVMNHLGDGSAFSASIRYVRETEPVGGGGAIRLAAPLLSPDFLLVFGDVLFEFDLNDLLATHRRSKRAVTLAAVHVDDRSLFGALDTRGDRILRIHEKQPNAGPGLIFSGIAAVDRSVGLGAPEGFSQFLDLFDTTQENVGCYEAAGYWTDMGSPGSLEELRTGSVSLLRNSRSMRFRGADDSPASGVG